MSLLILTLMFRKCSGKCFRPVPGTFLEELFLEHAQKLPRTIKYEKHMSFGSKAHRKRTGRCFCVVLTYHLAPRPFASA